MAAPRSTGTATISFGMVAIPVKFYTTSVSSSTLRFNMLHSTCGSRVKQQLYCPTDDAVVERKDTMKGYEYVKGQYVTFTAEELKAAEAEANQALEIVEFIPLDSINFLYLDQAQYLGPDKGGSRSYALLREAMNETGVVAVGRYAARGKQHVVVVRPFEHGLVMQHLRYADEIRPLADIPIDEVEVDHSQLALATQLIQQIASEKYQPDQYQDGVRKRLEEMIQQKVDGQDVTIEPSAEPKAQVIDLMEALKASLDKPTKTPKPARKARKPAATGRSKKRAAS